MIFIFIRATWSFPSLLVVVILGLIAVEDELIVVVVVDVETDVVNVLTLKLLFFYDRDGYEGALVLLYFLHKLFA